jgi:hypothetical protein
LRTILGMGSDGRLAEANVPARAAAASSQG